LIALIQFSGGLLLLIAGAEILVKGASRLAEAFRVSPLVIGLTVVAFGTSSPELAVSIQSALSGQAAITIGTVVGSNIFNVLFILGISALILPMHASAQLLRMDVPLMIILSILLYVISLNRLISFPEGAILVSGLILYILFLIRQNRKTNAQIAESNETEPYPIKNKWLLNFIMVAAGLAFLGFGSSQFLSGAVFIARWAGMSELIVGLTIVAAGTSMPEVVTSIMAAVRGERDIAIGNVVGSNIFNIMGVMGLATVLSPGGLTVPDSFIGFDIPVMIAVAMACLPVFFTGGVISRAEGLLLLGYYIAYTTYLILAASHHESLSLFSSVMLWFVIPLTFVILVFIAQQQLRQKNTQGHKTGK